MFNLRNNCKSRILIDFINSLNKKENENLILIIDDNTKLILDSSLMLNELLENKIYGIENITEVREPDKNTIAIYFITPDLNSINKVIENNKKYKSINLFFSHEITDSLVEKISENDDLCGYLQNIKEVNNSILPFNESCYELIYKSKYPFNNDDYIESSNCLNTLFTLVNGFSGIEIFYQNHEKVNYVMENIKRRIKIIQPKQSLISNNNIHVLLLDRSFDLFTPCSHDFHYQALVDDLVKPDWNKIESTLKDKKFNFKCNETDPLIYKYRYAAMQVVLVKLKKEYDDYNNKNSKNGNLDNIENLNIDAMNNIINNIITKEQIEKSFKVNFKLANEASDIFGEQEILDLIEKEQDIISGVNEEGSLEKEKKLIQKGLQNIKEVNDKLRYGLLLTSFFNLSGKEKSNIENLLNNKEKIIFKVLTDNLNKIIDFETIQKYSKEKIKNGKNQNIMRASSSLEIIVKEILNNKINNLKTFYYPENVKNKSITKNKGNNNLSNKLKNKGNEKNIFIIHVFGGITHTEIRQIKELEQEIGNIQFVIGSEKIMNFDYLFNNIKIIKNDYSDLEINIKSN